MCDATEAIVASRSAFSQLVEIRETLKRILTNLKTSKEQGDGQRPDSRVRYA
jgi:hypothetical protein